MPRPPPRPSRRPQFVSNGSLSYSDEFKADAVALYESTPGATYKKIAADLGISRGSLRNWVLRDRERRGVAGAARPSGGKLSAGATG